MLRFTLAGVVRAGALSADGGVQVTITPCRDGSPARWLTDQRRDWWDLVTRGPSGYERYARLRFIPDPTYDGQREMDTNLANDGQPEIAQLGIAVSALARFTTTADVCYFLIWEDYENLDHFRAATVSIPERPCYLFRGTAEDVSTLKDARDDSGELPITCVCVAGRSCVVHRQRRRPPLRHHLRRRVRYLRSSSHRTN